MDLRGKGAQPGRGVLAGATAAFEQSGADSDDPSMSENERVARAGTVGVTTGLGVTAVRWRGLSSAPPSARSSPGRAR